MSKQGLIYEIVCNLTGERYVGSTFEHTVARRICKHRAFDNACSSKTIIERDDYRYGLLETIQVNSRDELRMCERKWFDELECINLVKPYATDLEQKELKVITNKAREVKQFEERLAYRISRKNIKKEQDKIRREANKEEIKIAKKEYHLANKEAIALKSKAYREANKEAIQQSKKEYYETNKEAINLKKKLERQRD
jgi:hypothetical protein